MKAIPMLRVSATYQHHVGRLPIESASLSSLFTPGFLGTIGLMGDPNEEL
jgi:hypothetical protein